MEILKMNVPQVNAEIVAYIASQIIPKYANFDKGHNIDHAHAVISNSLEIAKDYEVNGNMVYCIAAYHDLGLQFDRKEHHIHSGVILLADDKLKLWFTSDELELMKEAVEDHRASNKHEPRSIYGKIVAEADRMIDYETILRRTVQFSLSHHPELCEDGHFDRTIQHITKKYGENGYLKLWIETRRNQEGLLQVRRRLENLDDFKSDFKRVYDIENGV